MIYIVKKPTDTPSDNSTGMVADELKRRNVDFSYLDLETINPFSKDLEGNLIWICGIKQDELQFEIINSLSINNKVVNSPDAIAICASKVQTTAKLIKNGVKTPETIFTASKRLVSDFLEKHGTVVYKPVYGFDGNGIYPFENISELKENPPYYIQEYVKNDRDFRVFVIDKKAVGAIERVSDSFAHNIHQGGLGRALSKIPPEMAETASAAAKAIGIDYCGVDLLFKNDSYTVLEVNGTPNWHCMSAPVPKLLADYLIETEKSI
ncbi:ATP-grasp domain-containing protein [Methanomicrobium antiquum]|uniref:ATP-grasp domain-containing protein n=1 Tax=Methanomicrobium antiquum TaxID=487686 RepID=A0AAF0FJJ5_9EURY|nr:ATP-grasp domain-containing protein [Methanomicrobium antiquum]MDD3977218.1 ATP-grasp domain-containing protein [Methanomicrobium sp.]WFN35763.1 ATP-grasp domain-containing protein [Methanomicrobium antiquum]